MIKSNIRFTQRILAFILMLLGCVLFFFGLSILARSEPSGNSITIGLFFLWAGAGFISMALMHMQTLKIEGEQVTIGTWLGLIKRRYSLNELIALRTKAVRTKYRTYPGLILQFEDGNLFQMNEQEFTNFRVLRQFFFERVKQDKNLKMPVLNLFSITYMAIGALILVLFLLVEAAGL